MSFSSCPKMWQCQTYSQPKLVLVLIVPPGIGLPVTGSKLEKDGQVPPSGQVGSSRRTLSGTGKGTLGTIGLIATIASSSGFILTVSFQPSSLASGGRTAPSQPTRLISCTLN